MLKASEAEAEAILAALSDPVIVFDTGGRYVRFAGRQPSFPHPWAGELAGKSVYDFPGNGDFFVAHIRHTLKQGAPHHFEYNLELSETSIWLEATMSPVSKDLVVAIIRDITERKRAETASIDRARIPALMADVGLALNRPDPLRSCLQHCTHALMRRLDVSFARIWLLNATDETLELEASSGPPVAGPFETKLPVENTRIGRIVRDRKPYFTNDLAADPEFRNTAWAKSESVTAVASHPLIVDDRVIGVMSLFSSRPISENVSDALALVADHIALGIERQRAEAARQLSEERFRLIAETVTEVFWMSDVETQRILYVSPAYERLWGRTCQSLYDEHESFFQAIHPDDRQRVMDDIARQESGIYFDHQYRIVRQDGEIRWIWDRSLPVPDNEGRIKYVIGVAQDITEQKRYIQERIRAETAARQAEERMQFALEAAEVGIWESDLKTGAIYWSETCERMHGLQPGDFGGTLDALMDRIVPEDRPLMREAIDRAVRENHPSEVEYRVTLPDGSVRRVSSTGQFAFDENGVPIRGAGVAVDVTDRRFLEEQLRQSQKMEAVGHLAGGVAHDFNNILTVIKGYSGLALEVLSKDDPLWSYLEDIQKAGLRAASLTSQLLAFSRKQVLQPKVVNLNSILSEVENLLRRVIGEDIQLRTVLTAAGNVKADPNQIEQVILNLAVNARDAMPKGGALTVEVRDVDLSAEYAHGHVGVQPGPHVMLAVTDSGIGMDKETQSKIFEPFYTTKNPGKGTGLGLSMVYGIVKQSGGSVWVYSEPGCGTTFKIYFPRVDEEASPYTKTVRHEKLAGTETILLTEDDESVRTLTRDVLQRYGYQVIVATDGKEAISISQKHRKKIHLLITDVIMPQMRGPDLAKKLTRKRPNLKVLYMSGYTDSVVLDSGFIDPAVHFLQKPFTPDLLASAVREVLGGPST